MSFQDQSAEEARPADDTSNKHHVIKPMHSSKTASPDQDKDSSVPDSKLENTMALPRVLTIPLASTVYPTEDHTAATPGVTEVKESSTVDNEILPGRFQGYGSTIPYAKFCADYPYTLKFPETIKPRDQVVEVQTVPEVNIVHMIEPDPSYITGGLKINFGRIRVPGAQQERRFPKSAEKI